MSASPGLRSTRAWGVLTVLFGVEIVGGVVLLVQMLPHFDFSAANPLRGITIGIVITVLLLILWIIVALVGAVRTRASWVRGSAVTIHVLLFAAGTGVLQGIIGTEPVGWVLVVLALAGFFTALIAKPERSALDQVDGDEAAPA